MDLWKANTDSASLWLFEVCISQPLGFWRFEFVAHNIQGAYYYNTMRYVSESCLLLTCDLFLKDSFFMYVMKAIGKGVFPFFLFYSKYATVLHCLEGVWQLWQCWCSKIRIQTSLPPTYLSASSTVIYSYQICKEILRRILVPILHSYSTVINMVCGEVSKVLKMQIWNYNLLIQFSLKQQCSKQFSLQIYSAIV